MPRMTDALAHQAGPGPSSLKLAALSANSYHLDSPPFTGTAGPLGENIDDVDRLSSSLRNAASTLDDVVSETSGDQTPAPLHRRGGSRERMLSNGSSQREQQQHLSQVMQEGLKERDEVYARNHNEDGDVPRWDLDDARHRHQLHRYPDNAPAARHDDGSPHVISHSLSPPPFSSSGQGPISTASALRGNAAAQMETSQPSWQRASRRRETSRPSFTQISGDSNSASNEDAGSATADGDADADESANEAEADGDETAYVVRSPTGPSGSSNKVPTQSQTKVS